MKKIWCLLLLLTACSQPIEQVKKEVPKTYEEIPALLYSAQIPEVFVYEENSKNSLVTIPAAVNEIVKVNIKVKSNLIKSELYYMASSQIRPLPTNCIKSYEVDEECTIPLTLDASVKGYVVMRLATSKGLRFMTVKIDRAASPSESFTLSNTVHNVGAISKEGSLRRVITVTNQGDGPLTVEATSLGQDRIAEVRGNTCLNIKPKRKCYVTYYVSGKGKNDGIYTGEILFKSGQTEKSVQIKDVQIMNSSSPNKLPVVATENLKTVVGELKELQVQGTDEDGDTLRYGYDVVAGVIITDFNENTGKFKVQANTLGVTNLKLWVTDGKSPAVTKEVPLRAYPQLVMNDKSFAEGEVQTPLFSLTLNAGSLKIISATTNMNDIFTILRVRGTGSTNTTNDPANLVGTSLPLSLGSSSWNMDFSGAVKYAGNKNLAVRVYFDDNTDYQYDISVQVEPSKLPLVKYDLTLANYTLVAGDSASLKGTMRTNLMTYILETYRTYQGWRTPILVRFKQEAIACGNVSFELFTDTADQQNCLRSKVSPDAESVFAFKTASSGGSFIGGIAQGLRGGAVVSATQGRQTVVTHELGHNFGLWHTHETYFNDALTHCDGFNCYNRNVYLNTNNGSASIEEDFSDFIINPQSSSPFTLFYNYGVGDDTAKDFYGARRVTFNPCLFGSCISPQAGFVTGNIVFLLYGQDGNSVCQQTYVNSPYEWPVNCNFNLPAYPTRVLESSVVRNVMSYWDKPASTSIYSNGQKQRMDMQINRYPILSSP